jgi:large subunit ribosomal protein L33
MAKSKKRENVKLKSTEPGSDTVYMTRKNKSNTPGRIELKKYDPKVRKHVIFKETK